MKAEDFPVLLGATRSAEAFRTAVSQIEEGTSARAPFATSSCKTPSTRFPMPCMTPGVCR